jgi:hypothetical protein
MRRTMARWGDISKKNAAKGHVPLFGKGGAAEAKPKTGKDARSIVKNDPDYKSMDKEKNKKISRNRKKYT